jgi:hypothetical protein
MGVVAFLPFLNAKKRAFICTGVYEPAIASGSIDGSRLDSLETLRAVIDSTASVSALNAAC